MVVDRGGRVPRDAGSGVCPPQALATARPNPHHALVIWALAVVLVVVGLAGVVLPALPGTVLIFAGLLLAAWADDFVRVGAGTIIGLGILTVATYFVDDAGRFRRAEQRQECSSVSSIN